MCPLCSKIMHSTVLWTLFNSYGCPGTRKTKVQFGILFSIHQEYLIVVQFLCTSYIHKNNQSASQGAHLSTLRQKTYLSPLCSVFGVGPGYASSRYVSPVSTHGMMFQYQCNSLYDTIGYSKITPFWTGFNQYCYIYFALLLPIFKLKLVLS